MDIDKLFIRDLNINTNGNRGHSLKMEKLGCARDIKKYFSQSGRTLECFGPTHGGHTQY